MTDAVPTPALLRALLATLVKAALIPDPVRLAGFRAEAAAQHRALAGRDLSGLKLDGIWALAVRDAEAPALRAEETAVSLTLPQTCPLPLDALTGQDFDFEAAAARVRASAATG
ncbi:hypothetical protein [Methylobacterium sp. JK268]